MFKENLRYWVLSAFVLCLGLNTQAIGESSEYEEINKKMIEEDIKRWRPVVPELVKVLKEEKDSERRADAAFYLGRARDLKAIKPLCLALLNDSVAEVRIAAAKALRWIAWIFPFPLK